jgi:hypothetical protein
MTEEQFITLINKVLDAARDKDIVLRSLGACAIRIHCRRFQYLHTSMARKLTDIDFISYTKHWRQIYKLFKEMNLEPNERFITLQGNSRQMYYDKGNECTVDVFLDKLEMSHTLEFKGRLELDYPTITLADLVLEKTQIVQINEKDIKDTVMVIREHTMGDTENETINAEYISKLLAKDWGLYYTVTTNLKKIDQYVEQSQALGDEDKVDTKSKIAELLGRIEKSPKSIGWNMRAKIGTGKKWYRDVEEIHCAI